MLWKWGDEGQDADAFSLLRSHVGSLTTVSKAPHTVDVLSHYYHLSLWVWPLPCFSWQVRHQTCHRIMSHTATKYIMKRRTVFLSHTVFKSSGQTTFSGFLTSQTWKISFMPPCSSVHYSMKAVHMLMWMYLDFSGIFCSLIDFKQKYPNIYLFRVPKRPVWLQLSAFSLWPCFYVISSLDFSFCPLWLMLFECSAWK